MLPCRASCFGSASAKHITVASRELPRIVSINLERVDSRIGVIWVRPDPCSCVETGDHRSQETPLYVETNARRGLRMPSRDGWRYQVLVVSTTKDPSRELNRLGADGWELASAVGVGEFGAVEEIWCFMKRSPPSRSSD